MPLHKFQEKSGVVIHKIFITTFDIRFPEENIFDIFVEGFDFSDEIYDFF